MFELREIQRPYPGLRPFEAWETEIFFGRSVHIERLLEILGRERFLAVIGPSGSGKSSLVRAGLLPALPRGLLGTGTRWRIAAMRPGNEPLRRLAEALLKDCALGGLLAPPDQPPADADARALELALLEAELRLGERSLLDVAELAARRQAAADEQRRVKGAPLNLLVLVDQFEELFTHLDARTLDNAGRLQLEDDANALVNLLLTARSTPQARVFVVLTLRTDFLGACVRFADLPDAINRAQYLTPRLQRQEIEAAIVGPARHFQGDISPGVVLELINAAGTDPDQLPILQHALGRMWTFASERAARAGTAVLIEAADFGAAGGMRNALPLHADSVLAGLAEPPGIAPLLAPRQVLARELFCAITEQRSPEAGGQMVRRPQALALIAAANGREPQDYHDVIGAFSADTVNFLTCPDELAPEAVIDISHEALIRQWERLRNWVAEEARRGKEYRRLRRQAEEHAANEVGLLTGAPLARADEWLRHGGPASDDGWRPSAVWASRYAHAPGADAVQAEFAQVQDFVAQSVADAEAEKQRLFAEEERRRQAELDRIAHAADLKLAAEQQLRFQQAELAAASQKRINHRLWAVALLALLLALNGYYQSQKADEKRRVVQGHVLWLPLTLESSQPSEKDADALLRVARSDAEHVSDFVTLLRDEEEYAERFLRAPAPVLASLVGPSPAALHSVLDVLDAAPASAASRDAGAQPPRSARVLAQALTRLVLVQGSHRDAALAQAFAAAARTRYQDDAAGWRELTSAIVSVQPELPVARRQALFTALRHEVETPGIAAPAHTALVFAMTLLRRHAPKDAVPALWDRVLRALLDPPASDGRREAEGAAEAPSPFPPQSAAKPDAETDEIPLPTLSKPRPEALRFVLSRLTQHLSEADVAARWQTVWTEFDQRSAAYGADDARNSPEMASAGAPAGGEGDTSRRLQERAELAQLLPALASRLQDNRVPGAYDKVLFALQQEFWTVPRDGRSRLDEKNRDAIVGACGNTMERLMPRIAAESLMPLALRLLALASEPALAPATRTALLDPLEKLLGRLAPEQASEFAARLAAAPKKGSAAALPREAAKPLWDTLRVRLSPEDQRHVPAWARKEDAPQEPEPEAVQAERLSPPAAPAAVKWTDPLAELKRLVGAVQQTDDSEKLQPLGRSLQQLAEQAPPARLDEIVETLQSAAWNVGDSDQLNAVVQGLRAAVQRQPPESTVALRLRLAGELNGERAASLRAELWPVYLTLARRAPPAERLVVCKEMVAIIETGRATSRSIAAELGKLAAQLDAGDKQKLSEALVAALQRVPESATSSLASASPPRQRFPTASRDRVRMLATVAWPLVEEVGKQQPDSGLTERLLNATLSAQSAAARVALGRLLVPAAGASQAQQRRSIDQIMASLPRCKRALEVHALTSSAAQLLTGQPPGYEIARDSFELMKYPFQQRLAADTLRLAFADAPKAGLGQWALIDWARERYPQLPLDQRPRAARP